MSTVTSLSSASISSAITADQTKLNQPVKVLQAQGSADKVQISAWGTIKGAVSSLSSALSNIASVGTAVTKVATSSKAGVANATAASSAADGTYTLAGISLAKAQEIYTTAASSAAAKLGTGASAGALTSTLTSGKTETVTVGSGSQTLSGIAAAVNAKAGGIQASVVGTSSGARLVFQSSGQGTANGFSLAGTGALADLSYTEAAHGAFTSAQAAANAALTINGVPVTSTSNTLSSAISGLKITLAGSGSTVLSVAASGSSVSNNLSAVAKTLSAAVASIAKETKFVSASATASGSGSAAKSGPLLGNVTAEALSNNLLDSISSLAASGLSAASVGFSVSATGAVTFDAGTFSTEYAANPAAVTTLVGKIYSTLHSVTAAALGSGSGSASTVSVSGSGTSSKGEIGAQVTALQNEEKNLTSQETLIQKENTAALQILVKEYTTAESAATNAQISQSYLSIFTSTSSSGSGNA
jgi:flagellar hook-associated protein 2